MEERPQGRERWAGTRVGVAIGPGGLLACEAARGRPWRGLSVALPAPEADGWGDALAAAFHEIADVAGPRAEVHVTLLRPLALAKALRLPPLRPAGLRLMVERGADRWFPLAPGPVAAYVAPLPSHTADADEPSALVSVASAALVETIVAAAAEAGLTVASISPSHAAAAAAALALAPELRKGGHLLVLFHDHSTDGLVLEDGRVHLARSLPLAWNNEDYGTGDARSAHLASLARSANAGAASIFLAGATADEEARAAAVAGWEDARRVPGFETAEEMAAFGATLASARSHDLRPDAHRLPARRAALRRTAVLLGLSAAACAFGAWMRLQRLEDEVARIERQRATLRPAVTAVLRTRAEIDSVQQRLAALDSLEAARPRWVPFFATLSDALPRQASLQSLRTDGAEVAVEGTASSASGVVIALGRADGLRGVRFASSVQREETAAGERERFSLRFGAPALLPSYAVPAGRASATRDPSSSRSASPAAFGGRP
jgi:Tfp pilus assembly protein PilN